MIRKVIRVIIPLPARRWLMRQVSQVMQYIGRRQVPLLARLISEFAHPSDAYQAFAKYNRHLIVNDYSAPIPDQKDLAFADRVSEMVGVEINNEQIFSFLDDVVHPYKQEFGAFPVHETGDQAQFYLVNGSFMAVDGNVYYSLIRHLKPRRIIEIGSGNSTLLAVAANQRNATEGVEPAELTCIEPFPKAFLRAGAPDLFTLIEARVQEVELTQFKALASGDILFIDSSHVLRSGNDVWWEYCEILPRLQSGVYVHVHDIELPGPYNPYYYKHQLFWNEQYLLQAFLAHNSRFEVVWPGAYMYHWHSSKMDDYFQPEYDQMRSVYPEANASSFWMRVKEAGA